METEKILRKCAKTLSGKGRKYASAIPDFNIDEAVGAVRDAANRMKFTLSDDDFIEIVAAAEGMLELAKARNRMMEKRGKLDATDVAHTEALGQSVCKAVRIVHRILKSK